MGLQKSPHLLLCYLKTPPSFLGGTSGGPVPMRLLAMVVPAYHGGLTHPALKKRDLGCLWGVGSDVWVAGCRAVGGQ